MLERVKEWVEGTSAWSGATGRPLTASVTQPARPLAHRGDASGAGIAPFDAGQPDHGPAAEWPQQACALASAEGTRS